MPQLPRPQVRTEEESEARENIELSSLPNERLAVTSKLHPFWKTKNGLAIVVLVILVFIGAIVGGAIGGKSNNNAPSPSESTPAATSATNTRPIREVFGTLAPRINDDFSGRRTHSRAFFDPSPMTPNPTSITPPALFKVVA